MRVRVPSTDALRQLARAGVDVTHEVAQGPDGTFDATVIVPRDNLAILREYGGKVLKTMQAPTQAEAAAELKGNADQLTAAQKRQAKPPASTDRDRGAAPHSPPPQAPDSTLTVLRADRWTSADGHFLSIEVRSDLGPGDTVTVETSTATPTP